MSLFGGSPFDDFFGSFFTDSNGFEESFTNGKQSRSVYSTETENFIQSGKKIYFVLDLSNFSDVNVSIKDKVITNEYGEKITNGKKIIEITSTSGEVLNYVIPKNLRTRGFQWKFKNGILEVVFRK